MGIIHIKAIKIKFNVLAKLSFYLSKSRPQSPCLSPTLGTLEAKDMSERIDPAEAPWPLPGSYEVMPSYAWKLLLLCTFFSFIGIAVGIVMIEGGPDPDQDGIWNKTLSGTYGGWPLAMHADHNRGAPMVELGLGMWGLVVGCWILVAG